MKYSFSEKLAIVTEVICGKPKSAVSREYHVDKKELDTWVGRYRLYGESGLNRKPVHRCTPEEKERIILEHVRKGVSLSSLSLRYCLDRSTIKKWLRRVRSGCSLYEAGPRGRSSRHEMGRPKKKEPQTELERLQAENLRLRAENALLKKVRALVAEQEARARLSGQEPSTN